MLPQYISISNTLQKHLKSSTFKAGYMVSLLHIFWDLVCALFIEKLKYSHWTTGPLPEKIQSRRSQGGVVTIHDKTSCEIFSTLQEQYHLQITLYSYCIFLDLNFAHFKERVKVQVEKCQDFVQLSKNGSTCKLHGIHTVYFLDLIFARVKEIVKIQVGKCQDCVQLSKNSSTCLSRMSWLSNVEKDQITRREKQFTATIQKCNNEEVQYLQLQPSVC